MEVVENQVVSGKTIAIDEKLFDGGRYTNCTFVHSGGEFSWRNTMFDNCHFTFAGAAQRTVSLLGNLGLIPPSGTKLPPGGQLGFPKKPSGGIQ
jgi:hypothetical protein